DFREMLLANNTSGYDQIIRELDSEFNQVVSQNTIVGSKINRLQLVADQLDDLEIIQKEQRSQIEDTDIAEAILELRTQETTLQAALETSGRILSLSLLDYI
ncbi:hypothetical protein KDK77_09255, partial [bacterium]|nr:hypothetical protein [bacterium]